MDQVVLVDEQDKEIGVMDKVEAHRGEGKLHRAISVFLFNAKKELLIQQRSEHKIVGTLQWANTCCGNVRPGESYEECANRRLREELGITGVKLTPIAKFQYQVKCNEEFSEREMDTVFIGRYDGEVVPNPREVKAYEWIDFTLFYTERIEQRDIAPWVKIMKEKEIVQKIQEEIWVKE